MIKYNFGWIVAITLSLFPLVLWYMLVQPVSYRFINPGTTLTSLGQMTALVGLVLYSISFCLSTRAFFVEEWFGGMNRAYIAHHIIGGSAFVLLMLHPLLLSGKYATVSLRAAALFLLPGTDIAINFGIAALMTMMALLIITFFIKLTYQVWLFTHKFLGVAFLLGSIHSFLIPSDISRDPFLRVYMLAFIGIGLASFIYRTLLGRTLVRRYHYEVTSVRRHTATVVEIELAPLTGKTMHYLPGQFVFISFPGTKLSETHPFSINSAPSENLKLTAKVLGDWTGELTHVAPHTEALVEGPFGRFSYFFYDNTEQIWIAGGIGITPFVSMARAFSPEHHVDLYYCVHTPEEAVYLEELKSLALIHRNLRVIPWVSATQGRLAVDEIVKTSGDIHKKDIYICGPPAMMHSLRQKLQEWGLKNAQVHTEEFEMR